MAFSRLRQPEESQESQVKMLLFNCQGLGHDEAEEITGILSGMTLKQLKVLAKDCNIRLTGSSKKGEVMDRILAMARIGAIRGKHDGDDDEVTGISYITDEVRGVLRTLPLFSKVTEWSKELGEKLTDFSLVNIIVYLVYGRDKTFDMHALRAHKSLKAYTSSSTMDL